MKNRIYAAPAVKGLRVNRNGIPLNKYTSSEILTVTMMYIFSYLHIIIPPVKYI